MYIRRDVKDKIKQLYKTEKMKYIGIEKSTLNTPGMIFEMDEGKKLALLEKNNGYFAFIMIDFGEDGRFFNLRGPRFTISFDGNWTFLTDTTYFGKTKTTKFKGNAFNFDKELVLIRLEQ